MNPNPPPLTLGERFRIGASLIPPVALLWIASRRGWVPLSSGWCLAAMPLALLLGMLLPGIFEGWHRAFSAGQSWAGRWLVRILLGLVFLLVVAPLGIVLRVAGISFLGGKPAASYWTKVRPPSSLRTQF